MTLPTRITKEWLKHPPGHDGAQDDATKRPRRTRPGADQKGKEAAMTSIPQPPLIVNKTTDAILEEIGYLSRAAAMPPAVQELRTRIRAIIGSLVAEQEAALPPVSPKQQRKLPTKPQDYMTQLRAELRRLNAQRFKSGNTEIQIARLQAQIDAKPERWKVGQGVGWKPVRGQVNRGYRIEQVIPGTKEAIIRPVGDIGQLADYTGEAERVSIIDLIRDRKYDATVSGRVPPVTAPGAPRGGLVEEASRVSEAEVVAEKSRLYDRITEYGKLTSEQRTPEIETEWSNALKRLYELDEIVKSEWALTHPKKAKWPSKPGAYPLLAETPKPQPAAARDIISPGAPRGGLVEEGGRIPQAEVAPTGAKEPWQMTREEFFGRAQRGEGPYVAGEGMSHEGAVRRAIAEGKPVPPEVLADYPDLAAKAAPTTPQEAVAPPPITEPSPGMLRPEPVEGGAPPPMNAGTMAAAI